jgi:hypothetical protein
MEKLQMRIQSVLALTFVSTVFTACVDPKGRFEEFEDRVPDAGDLSTGPDAAPLDGLPDINGEFLVAVSPTIAPEALVQLAWSVSLTSNADGTGTIAVTTQAFSTSAAGRTRVGEQTTVDEVPVNNAGEFMVSFEGLVLPGSANGLTGAELMLDVHFAGTIKTADAFCGVLSTGSAVLTPMVDVSGSTFGAVRIAAGAEGDALPAALPTCPTETPGDADAGPGAADAGLPDAEQQGS